MDEFSVIKKYFASAAQNAGEEIILGIGDDCALISAEPGYCVAVSTDTFAEGTHFFKGLDPRAVGHKALAAALSDLPAMGAEPLCFTLALTLPEADESFLAGFSAGLFKLARQEGIPLVGGDTTGGPLSVTVTVLGKVRKGEEIRRDGARAGDVICVSGPLGGAAYGVSLRYGAETAADAAAAELAYGLLDFPRPRTDLTGCLRRYGVSAAIDVSDGFLGDLGHILESSAKSAEIALGRLPVSAALGGLPEDKRLDYALNGGDDYELCFTLAEEDLARWQSDASAGKTPAVYPVGRVTDGTGSRVAFIRDGAIVVPEFLRKSFNHFA